MKKDSELKIIGREIMPIEKKLLISEDGKFLTTDLDLLNINCIRMYEPIYINICGAKSFVQEEENLRWAFTYGMFNVLDYINSQSRNISGYLPSWKQFDYFISLIKEDLEKGYIPGRLGVYCAQNTQKIRRFKCT